MPFSCLKTSRPSRSILRFANIISGLQMTVSHRTLVNQILPVSDKIPTRVGPDFQTIFLVNHFMVGMNTNLLWVNLTFFEWCPITDNLFCPTKWCLSMTYVLSRPKHYLQPCYIKDQRAKDKFSTYSGMHTTNKQWQSLQTLSNDDGNARDEA